MENLISELVKTFKTRKSTPDQVDLPIFHPETNDATKWLEQVEKMKAELSWSDAEIFVRVGRYLIQNARKWHDEWSPKVRECTALKKLEYT